MIRIKYKDENVISARRGTSDNNTSELPKVELSSKFIEMYKIESKKVIIKFGNWTEEFVIKMNSRLSDETIVLPKSYIPYDIPESLPYEIKVEGNRIHLGPVIAFIAAKESVTMSKKVINKYKDRFKKYKEIGGLLFLCSSSSIDTESQEIEGYFFNPASNNQKDSFIKGVFPYPDSIFKKVRIPLEKERELKRAMGNKIFNTNFFNKLDLWNACSTNENVKQYLPVTKRYKSLQDLKEMLSEYDQVYLKPISGAKGNGIIMVKKDSDGAFHIITSKEERMSFNTITEAGQYLNKILQRRKYLVQQGIPTIYKKKHVDFRLYLQKDSKMEWFCQGAIGRVAQEGSIITNLKYIAHLSSGEKAIQIVFNVSNNEAKNILHNTIKVCKEICKGLEAKLGHFGDIALDVIIDQNQHPWILEVNNSYGTKSLHVLKDKDTLSKLKTTPFEYAKGLAGF